MPVVVACGDSFCMLLDCHGKVYTWGDGSAGVLGNGVQGYTDELI